MALGEGWSGLGRARRRGGGWRRRHSAWGAAWHLAKGLGTRAGARRGQADIHVSSAAFLGPDGRGRAVDKVHRQRTGERRRKQRGRWR